MPINLRQLSDHLGLSPTTVSRALNGYPEVSESTRKRVVRAARQLNYRPSHQARHLARGRTNTIAHVVSKSRQTVLGPHFADFIASASETASKMGYDTLLSLVDDQSDQSLYQDLMVDGKADGAVLHGPSSADERIAHLQSMQLPFVVHGRGAEQPFDYAWLDVDNYRAMRRATELLLDLGHQDIVLLNGDETLNYAVQRRAGFEDALRTRGLSVRPDLQFANDLTEHFSFQVISRLLGQPNAPTAVVTSGMLQAFGALRAAQSLGLRPGADLSIVTYDDQLTWLDNHGSVPLFTAVRSSIQAAAVQLVIMLIAVINDPEAPPPTELWEAELVIGQSTGPPANRTVPTTV